MSKGDGHINAGIVNRSPRLMRIVEILKEAEYPLSAQEIAIRAYDFPRTGKVMLNVSTNVCEIRAQVNRDLGYVVSDAEAWKSDRYSWHDGRPRYRLLAAPGWEPAWTIAGDGNIELCAGRNREASAVSTKRGAPAVSVERFCKNPNCSKPLPSEDPASWFCDDDCRRQWRAGLQIKMQAGS